MRTRFLLCLVVVGLLAASTGPALASTSPTVEAERATAATAAGPTLGNVTYGGNNAVNGTEGLVLWQGGSHTFTTTVDGDNASGQYDVCLYAGEPSVGESLACKPLSTSDTGGTSVSLSVGDWPANDTGEGAATVTIQGNETDEILTQRSLSLTVITSSGDFDGDGLGNKKEVKLKTDPTKADTDGDGLSDKKEVTALETNPRKADSDGDGLADGRELKKLNTSPVKSDTDGDGLSDSREVKKTGTNPNKADTDDDGLNDLTELETYDTDPTDADTDGDSLSDGKEVKKYDSDPTEVDTDGDGLDDGTEVHVHGTDPTTKDTDGDGLSDRAEIKRYQTDPTKADTDGDGLDDGPEINTYDTSPVKADSDGDGFDDGAEIDAGTGPLDPESHPERTIPIQLPDTGYTAVVGGLALLLGGVLLLSVVARATPWLPDPTRLASVFTETSVPPSEADGGRDDPSVSIETDTDDGDSPEASTQASTTADGIEDHHLLTNEERVTQLLEANDGRLHQSDIVEQTDWSKSKVSRVLSRMEEEGAVSKIPLGKENLITIPGAEPEGAKSPHSSIEE